MPYIYRKDRTKFNQHVDRLAEIIKTPGEMNYVITTLLKKKYGPSMNYYLYNEIIGVLECVKLEVYRRWVSVYEDLKIKENGDV